MIVIGLTGSVGMGKTTVANMMRDMKIPVHDSDAAVHVLLGPGGGAVDAVSAAFPGVLTPDGGIDRQALGRIVFGDRKKKKQLEDILHPLVRAESDAFKADLKKRGAPCVVLDIPLLFETGGENRVDVTIVVTAPPEIQRTRVLARPGMTSEKFERIVGGQMPDSEKKKRADYIIENGGDLNDTRRQLDNILAAIGKRRRI